MHDFAGVFVPVPTPFTDDGAAISEIRLARWLRKANEWGASGFVVGGDAGEFAALTFTERKQLFDLTLRNAGSSACVLAHVSALSTAACIDLAHHAAESGAQAAVIMAPYYGRFSDAELKAHFHAVAHHGRLPLFVVDPQARILFELHEALSEMPEVRIATSMANSGHVQCACFEKSNSDEFVVGEAMASPLAALGWAPGSHQSDECLAVQRLFHDYGTARVLKAASDWVGVDLGPLRNPMRDLPASAHELLKTILQEAA